MLYLIKVNNYLKIGYTNNLKERLKCYETHNPDFELLDVIEGDTDDEKFLHLKFNSYKHKNEWFIYDEEIIKGFKEFKHSLNADFRQLKERIEMLENRIEYLEKELGKTTSLLNFEEMNNIFSESIQKLQQTK